VSLSFQSRQAGDITVVRVSGRIVEGAEATALQQHLKDLLARNPYIILNLGDVEFIDSSGVGLLLRCFTQTQNLRGILKVCAVSSKIEDALKVTRLASVFEGYDSEAEAIAGFYRPSRAAAAPVLKASILCVDKSPDVLAYVREVLRQTGYGIVTAGNLADAVTLLTATHPKLVVIEAALRSDRETRTGETFNRLADAVTVVELPADFSSHEAAEAGQQLLDQVTAILSR